MQGLNKKNLYKIILCILGCMGIAVVTRRMPELMQAVYDAVFNEFDHISLFFVLGVLFFELFVLKRWGRDSKSSFLCLGITVMTASLVLFGGEYQLCGQAGARAGHCVNSQGGNE